MSLNMGTFSGRLSEAEVTSAARGTCDNTYMWYNKNAMKCQQCSSGVYNKRTGKCAVSAMDMKYMPATYVSESYCAEFHWKTSLLGGNKLRFTAPAAGSKYWIFFKTLTYQYSYNGCSGDSESWIQIYPVIDGVRNRDYCQYDYNRGWGRTQNVHSTIACSFNYDFAKGDHTIDFDVWVRGHSTNLYGYPYSSVRAQFLGKITPLAVPEPKAECRGRTSR